MLEALFGSFFLILLLWWIFGSIGKISDSIQFQEVSDWSVFMLYLPSIIVNLVWIYCIFKYFKPSKHFKKTETFAKPVGEVFDSTRLKTKRDRIRQFLIIGTVIALITVYIRDIASYGHGDSWTNLDRKSLRTTISPILKTLGNNLEQRLSSTKNSYSQQIQTRKVDEWENIFTSDLACFEIENIAYQNAFQDMEFYNLDNYIDENDKYDRTRKMIVYYEPFECRFSLNETNDFKLRFDTHKCYEIDERNQMLLYDAKLQQFVVNTTQHKGKTGKLLRHSYFFAHVLNFWTSLGVLEYDSKTKECKFIYDNDWDNFKENYKCVIYLSDYLLMFLTCFAIVLTCRHLREIRMISMTESMQ